MYRASYGCEEKHFEMLSIRLGLVVAGQTESTLALEAFAKEVECEEVQAFYNTAVPAEGTRDVIKEHAADANINALLASGIDDIADHPPKRAERLLVLCISPGWGDTR